jgi:hypothetical protein
MREHDKSNRGGMSEKTQGRVGASVLVAAASMLGTSLGVWAATPVEPLSAQDSASHNAVETTPVGGKNLLLAKGASAKPSTPHVSAKPQGPQVIKALPPGTHVKNSNNE